MNSDLEKLRGTWNIVEIEMDGQRFPPGGSKIVISGTGFTTIAMGATYEGTLEIDQSQTPKTFNLNFTQGPEKGNTSLGIYELDADTWKICLTIRGSERPKQFAIKPGTGLALETLKRETAA